MGKILMDGVGLDRVPISTLLIQEFENGGLRNLLLINMSGAPSISSLGMI
jgi:hypothetical protein